MNKRRITGIILFCILIILTGCTKTVAPQLTPITVQLQWIHQAQFAGLYAADQNGYYAEEGLAVTFVPGVSGVDSLNPLLEGSAQFGTATADQVLVAQAEGKPLKAFAVVYRRSPAVFMALSSSGITRQQDFVGKTIRLPAPNAATLHAMMAGLGIPQDQYTEVDLPSDVEAFASGDVPVWAAYINALTVSVQRAGYEINIIYPDDYGVHFYLTPSSPLTTSLQIILTWCAASCAPHLKAGHSLWRTPKRSGRWFSNTSLMQTPSWRTPR